MTNDPLERALDHGWYHTIELAPGKVTEGMFDLRPVVDKYGIPKRLDGKRCLDIGTWDGFWSFEMERRGAAEVIALDLDDERALDYPPRRRPETFSEGRRGDGFRMARELLGSSVQRVVLSVYDAKPEELGTFDVVFCGSVIMHLRDQMLALERIANLCSGTYISAEEYDRWAGLLPVPTTRYLADRDKDIVFWLPAAKTWRRMMYSAGFDRVEERGKFKLPARAGWTVRHQVLHSHKDGG